MGGSSLLLPSLVMAAVSLASGNTNVGYIMTSGIAKEWSAPFVLKKDHVLDITTQFQKAQDSLGADSQFYLFMARGDDRYFEVDSPDQVLADPNSREAPITQVTWCLLQRYSEDPPGTKPRRIAKVLFHAKTSKTQVEVDARELSWALISADALESSVKRTHVVGFNPINVMILVLGVLTYVCVALLLLRLVSLDKFKTKAAESLLDMNLVILVQFPPLMFLIHLVLGWDRFVTWLKYSRSYFLWGDAVDTYTASAAFQSNLLWVVIVGFAVALAANIITGRVLARQQKNRIATGEHPAGGDGKPAPQP